MNTDERPEPKTVEPAVTASGRRRGPRKLALMLAALAALGAAAAGGYFAGRRQAGPTGISAEAASPEAPKVTTWYCSMHPTFISNDPTTKCGICFMDLVPLEEDDGAELGPRQLRMSKNAVALADIQTSRVKRQHVSKEIRMVGKVDYDETRLVDSTAWIPGRLDRLYVNYTGVLVREGDHLFHIYSPKLVVAQDELLLALKAYQQSRLRTKDVALNNVRLAEDKLRLWGVRDEQIEEIKHRGKASDHITIYAPVGGIVISKHVNEGAYVKEGTPVYTIADLSQVWIYLDAYESDVAWLRYGQEVEFTTESYPGEIFKGQITFIDPVLNEQTRTVRVRVNVPNPDLRLKPGMFARAVVRSWLAAGGRVLDSLMAGKWICPMHQEIVKDAADKDSTVLTCDLCGMDLVAAEELGMIAPDRMPELPLVIPVTAPLRTGKRAVVYVKVPDRGEPIFEGREVLLGHRAGDYYIVRHGLEEGEEVVTSGNFKIDSALQIKAKPSMMSPEDALAEAGPEDRTRLDVSGSFRVALNPLYRSYLATGRALGANDLEEARRAVGNLHTAASAVDVTGLDEDARWRWKRVADAIIFAALETSDGQDRETARRHFSELSGGVIWLVQSFGHALPDSLHHLRCTMALDYGGGHWLQWGEEIANPYFGSARPLCGELIATFKSQAPLDVPDAFRRQLAGLYGAYLQVQEALADDRLADAVAGWQATRRALGAMAPEGLGPREAVRWQKTGERLAENLHADLGSAEIAEVRKQFEGLSVTMLEMVEAFGHVQNVSLFKAYCFMAFGDVGAAWLQAGDTVANPYLGSKTRMRRCGTIQRTFVAARPPATTNPARGEVR